MKYRGIQIDLREYDCHRKYHADAVFINTSREMGLQHINVRGPHGKMLFVAACDFGRAISLNSEDTLGMIKGLIDEKLGK